MATGDRTVIVETDRNSGAIWFFALIAILAIVGAVWFFAFGNQSGSTPVQSITHNTTINVPAPAGNTSNSSGSSGSNSSSGGTSGGDTSGSNSNK